MSWRDALNPVGMQRVALLSPADAVRDLLVAVADAGTVEIDLGHLDEEQSVPPGPASARLQHMAESATTEPALSREAPDPDACAETGRVDLLRGEAEVERYAAGVVTRGRVAALAGWMPETRIASLAERVAPSGGAVVTLSRPPGVQPPTLMAEQGAAREFAPLVSTYATVPYPDVNPAVIAGLAYVVMFGMMFADSGQGLLLAAAALAIRSGRWVRLQRLRPVWLFLLGAGISSAFFGLLYGEFFGPTGVIPVIWLSPLEEPVTLLGAAVGVGAVLLAGAYALGSVNRYREGGWRLAVYAPSGLAGAALYAGLGTVVGGLWFGIGWVVLGGAVLALGGLGASYAGLLASSSGGAGGAVEAGVELFDLVVRLGSNVVSFARLAAFGMTHAALAAVVWQATTSLWGHGVAGAVGAVVVFLVGNAVTFALEGLVAAIQALRLEYYELFSRIFDSEGRPFRPWHVPITTEVYP